MHMLSLWKRFVASCLDKLTILFIFVIVMLFVQYTPFTAAGKLGIYVAELSMVPSNYEYLDLSGQSTFNTDSGVSEYYQLRERIDNAQIGEQSAKEVDLTITIWFIIINFLYFLTCELFMGASLFKHLFGGVLVNKEGEKLSKYSILVRNFLFFIILCLVVLLRFLLNTSYVFIVVIFFILFDFMVFTRKRNLLDVITGSYLVSQKNVDQTIPEKEALIENVKRYTDEDGETLEAEQREYYNAFNYNTESKENFASLKSSSPIYYTKDIEPSRNEERSIPDKVQISHYSSRKGTNKKYLVAFWMLLLIPSLYQSHKIFTYFLDDYYNVDNYNLEKDVYRNQETANEKRKKVVAHQYIEYTKECFFADSKIGDSISIIYNKWLNFDFGPLPKGRYISTYQGSESDSYFAGNKVVTRYRSYYAPKYRIVDYGYGITDKVFDGYETKYEPYKDYDPVYLSYNWRYALSTFDIGDKIAFYEDEDSAYSRYLKDFEVQLKANFNYKSHYTKAAGKKAFVYYTDNGTPLKRVLFCANGRAYFMETESITDLDKHSGIACSKLNVKDFNLNTKDKSLLGTAFLTILLCSLIIIFFYILKYRKLPCANRLAYKCFLLGLGAIALNYVIALIQSYQIYSTLVASPKSAFALIGSLLTISLVVIPLCVFYLKKSKEPKANNYFIPSVIRKNIYDRISNGASKRLYLTFVIYPLMMGSLLPLSVYIVLLYILPAILLTALVLGIIRWFNWVRGGNLK